MTFRAALFPLALLPLAACLGGDGSLSPAAIAEARLRAFDPDVYGSLAANETYPEEGRATYTGSTIVLRLSERDAAAAPVYLGAVTLEADFGDGVLTGTAGDFVLAVADGTGAGDIPIITGAAAVDGSARITGTFSGEGPTMDMTGTLDGQSFDAGLNFGFSGPDLERLEGQGLVGRTTETWELWNVFISADRD